jgi:predicted RNA-binding protein YlqC (UPF0109 family)
MMKEFVEYVIKNLVDHPDQVVVTEFRNEDILVLELQVAPDDMGRVIGKGGRVANSLRSLLRVMAIQSGEHVSLEIL